MLVNVGAATGPYWVQLNRLRELLATQGLAVVPESDIRTDTDLAEAQRKLEKEIEWHDAVLADAERYREALHQAESDRDTARDDLRKETARWSEALRNLTALQAKVQRAMLLVSNVIAYLSDQADVESTPGHAIGHAKHEAQKALEALR